MNRIILQSHKGVRIEEPKKCAGCETVCRLVYRYSKSNLGQVYLCIPCKEKALENSFDSLRTENEHLVGKFFLSGGGWETNRSKH